jgi:hypothetical protein
VNEIAPLKSVTTQRREKSLKKHVHHRFSLSDEGTIVVNGCSYDLPRGEFSINNGVAKDDKGNILPCKRVQSLSDIYALTLGGCYYDCINNCIISTKNGKNIVRDNNGKELTCCTKEEECMTLNNKTCCVSGCVGFGNINFSQINGISEESITDKNGKYARCY